MKNDYLIPYYKTKLLIYIILNFKKDLLITVRQIL